MCRWNLSGCELIIISRVSKRYQHYFIETGKDQLHTLTHEYLEVSVEEIVTAFSWVPDEK